MKYGRTVVGSIKPGTPAFLIWIGKKAVRVLVFYAFPSYLRVLLQHWVALDHTCQRLLLNNCEKEDRPPSWKAMHDGRQKKCCVAGTQKENFSTCHHNWSFTWTHTIKHDQHLFHIQYLCQYRERFVLFYFIKIISFYFSK